MNTNANSVISTKVTYTLNATWDNKEWFQLGKELKSSKSILAALKKKAYPPDLKQYTALKWIKNTKSIVSEVVVIDENI